MDSLRVTGLEDEAERWQLLIKKCQQRMQREQQRQREQQLVNHLIVGHSQLPYSSYLEVQDQERDFWDRQWYLQRARVDNLGDKLVSTIECWGNPDFLSPWLALKSDHGEHKRDADRDGQFDALSIKSQADFVVKNGTFSSFFTYDVHDREAMERSWRFHEQDIED